MVAFVCFFFAATFFSLGPFFLVLSPWFSPVAVDGRRCRLAHALVAFFCCFLLCSTHDIAQDTNARIDPAHPPPPQFPPFFFILINSYARFFDSFFI